MAQGKYGDTNQGAAWTGGVGRVQSKCRPGTGECLEPVIIDRYDRTDKQTDWYKRHTPETIVRRWPGSSSGWGSRSQRTADRMVYVNRDGLTVSLEKTAVVWVGPGRTELEIHLDGKKVKPRDSFVHQVGAICEDGNSNTEIRRRMTAGANTWRKVEGATGMAST